MSTDKHTLPLGKATRDAFGEALLEVGRENLAIVVVDGDVANSTRTEAFGKTFPTRFFNLGIAESNMVSVASGLAAAGKTPLVSSFAVFLLDNAYDQIRMGVAFPNLNVKLMGSHSGISIGEDGPSQMAIEDLALATSFPNMTVSGTGRRARHARRDTRYVRTYRPGLPAHRSSKGPHHLPARPAL
jgi:transketolase